MSSPRLKRLAREVAECQKDTSKSGITIRPVVADQLDKFIGTFPGPEGTPYEGGTFEVEMEAPDKYPFAPLKMKFITKVYHPNVSSASGFICLDILKTSWSPVFTLRTCLVSLQSLLSTPEPSDPQDAEVAKHYLTSREGFDSTAKYWTEVYANGTKGGSQSGTNSAATASKPKDDKAEAQLAGIEWSDVSMFTEMGFDAPRVIEVLKHLNYRSDNRARVGHDAVLERLFG